MSGQRILSHEELEKLSKEELIRKIDELQNFRRSWEKQEEERLITEEKLEFSWSGNLGRWVWDREEGTVTYNRRKVEVLGYDYETFGNSLDSFLTLIHPDDYNPAMEAMRRHLYGKTPVYEVEYRMRNAQGGYRWFYDRGRVVDRDAQGKPLRLMGIVFDVTESKGKQEALEKALDEAKQATEARDRLYSLIAHDLRAPLNTFSSFVALLRMQGEEYSSADREALYDDVEKVVQKTNQLIDNMIQWARSQTGRLKPRFYQEDVRKALSSVKTNLSLQAREKEISLEWLAEGEASDFTVPHDSDMIQGIFRNLVSNAIKYCHAGDQVTVRLSPVPEGLYCGVEDTGVGMKASVLESVRDSLRWMDSSPGTAQERGSGFGLSVVKDFLKYHASDLKVQSREGEGSLFSFILPREKKEE